MMRVRRYRVFVVFAVIAVFAFYQFTRYGGDWEAASAIGAGSLKQFGLSKAPTKAAANIADDNSPDAPKPAQDLKKPQEPVKPVEGFELSPGDVLHSAPLTDRRLMPTTTTTLLDFIEPEATQMPVKPSKTSTPAALDKATGGQQNGKLDHLNTGTLPVVNDDLSDVPGIGRFEVPAVPSVSRIHWSQQPEHFPLSSTIQLPSGTPKSIPRIQHKFEKETAADKKDREKKLQNIVQAAKHAWKGYKDHAWMHDEVRPVSGGKRDPFCGWAATLVDSLDTLWIMGFNDDFEQAVQAVGKIDFTTSLRKDIPLFETTIRYLGGMLAAYDISGAKYPVLLQKSVELAEILMGAFDTPNRMPMTFYHWMPAFASQPHRATTRVVLAEIGSLSLEFTRLAQLTKEPKYYDAIARITDAFEEWQDRKVNGTLLPGMWPTKLDASGCEKPAQMLNLDGSSKSDQLPLAGTDGRLTSQPVQVDKAKSAKTNPVQGNQYPADEDEGSAATKALEAPASAVPGIADSQDDKTAKSLAAEKPAPGQGKIKAWDDPLEEGGLDNKNTKPATALKPAAGQGKIKAWGDPLDEGSLDNKGAKALKPAAEKPGKGRITAWDDPADEDDVDQPAAKVKSLGSNAEDLGAAMRKRQVGGVVLPENPIQALGLDRIKPAAPVVDAGAATETTAVRKSPLETEVCISRGLASPGQRETEKFTLGGLADSVYEYLPKEYLLLGGLEGKYRTMYEAAVDAATESLLYRPMTPDNLDILMAGEWRAYHEPDTTGAMGVLYAEGAHLTCFAGGMYALGAKIFNRPEDLDRAAKLTEGCVWAYGATTTGIMPEKFELLACDSLTDCKWNRTRYYEALDPYEATRMKTPEPIGTNAKPVVTQSKAVADTLDTTDVLAKLPSSSHDLADHDVLDGAADHAAPPSGAKAGGAQGLEDSKATELLKEATDALRVAKFDGDTNLKRQLDTGAGQRSKAVNSNTKSEERPKPVTFHTDDITPNSPPASDSDLDVDSAKLKKPSGTTSSDSSAPLPDLATAEDPDTHSAVPLPHLAYVAARIADERLPPGFTHILSSKYILRPEAIESVFYLYRITGSPHWRDVGWTMWQAVQRHTATTHGHSAIDDVTAAEPTLLDEEESFWLAETLKYYYLLFQDEEVLSLDQWVLNTEAHPFRRPDFVD